MQSVSGFVQMYVIAVLEHSLDLHCPQLEPRYDQSELDITKLSMKLNEASLSWTKRTNSKQNEMEWQLLIIGEPCNQFLFDVKYCGPGQRLNFLFSKDLLG